MSRLSYEKFSEHCANLGDAMEVRETTRNRLSLVGLSFALGVVVFATCECAGRRTAEAPTGEAAEAATDTAADAPAEVAAEVPAEPAKQEAKAVIAEGASEASLNLGVAYFEDVNGELTIEKLVDGSANVEFLTKDNREETPNFGLNPSVFWFKVQIENLAETVQWVVEVDYSMLDTITFYAQGADGSYQGQVSGDSEAFEGRYWAPETPTLRWTSGRATQR